MNPATGAMLVINTCDAEDDTKAAKIVVRPDKHGCTIDIGNNDRYLVIDHSEGLVRVYLTNENGDVDSDPIATFLPVSLTLDS